MLSRAYPPDTTYGTVSMELSGRVLITGGTGFLARAIYRRAEREGWDVQFTCLSRDDWKQSRIKARWPSVKCVRGNVAGSLEYLTAVMAGHDTVIHAAAVKYVDRSESLAYDTVDANVFGSRSVAFAAGSMGVKTCVAISTDKAVSPENTYGATKMLMERMWLDPLLANAFSATRYVGVRYGNVVGSTGSVIPKLIDQWEANQQFTITSGEHTRFWLSPDDAVDVILRAMDGTIRSQHVLIPRLGAMSMLDMCEAIAGREAPIRQTGNRPGEKIHESLLSLSESVRTVEVDDRYIALMPPDSGPTNTRPFALESSTAPRLTRDELWAMIENARDIVEVES